MVLTEEQKAEFIKKGERYKNLKYKIDEEIIKHQVEIGNLEKQLRDSAPKTPNGRLVCKTCNVRSMAYVGRILRGGLSDGEEIHQCEIMTYIGRTPQRGLSGGEEIHQCEICERYWVGNTLF